MTSAAPALTPPAATRFPLPSVAFFGRSFHEYCHCFALDPTRLRGRPVLDVAAGPSSFTAEACRLGIDAVAVDPMYGYRGDTLAAQVQRDYATVFRLIREQPELVRVGAESAGARFESVAAAERDRRAAAQRFLEDYEAHFVHGRYYGASLPHLPFLDHAFDIVLCAHLLFIYPRQFDYPFHLAACRELVRVSRDEVRLHPLCGPDGLPYPEFVRLCDDLAADGIASRVVPVASEFFRGTNSTLVLTRRKP